MENFVKGQQLTAAQLNQIVEAVRANTPRSGMGTIVRGGSGGYVSSQIDTTDPYRGSMEHSFRPRIIFDKDDKLEVYIIGSYVLTNGANIVPKLIKSVIGTSTTEADNDILVDGDPEYTPPRKLIPDDGVYYIQLDISADACGIHVNVEADKDDSLLTTYKFELKAKEVINEINYMETGLPMPSAGTSYPLEIITSRPAYVPVPTNPLTPTDPPTTKDFWVRYGTIQHVEATNFNEDFTLDLTSTGNVYVYAKVVLSQGDQLEVTSWTIEQDTTSPEMAEGWSATKIRPTTLNLMLGYWVKPATAEGSWTMITQHGDIQLDEYIVHISASSNNYTRRIASRRLT